ncbi:MAG: SusC/RagA family TonB-linked outer membrane protein, partial [Cyclobacteriaceae bacterium]|nr:SusC/RagA family TonB-linked outer membrane protein [Cyclobacteriaceae bacterium HetDA_MAG_MS6]
MQKFFTMIMLIGMTGFSIGLSAQDKVISGKVVDASDGSGLPGANVVVKGTTVGSVSDIDGNYRLTAPAGSTTLVVTYTGYTSQEVEIGSRAVIDFSLVEDLEQLDEVVITAFGLSQEKKALANAVQSVGGEELANARESNLVNAINAKVAGVQVISQGGQAGAGSSIVIRGNTSVSRSNQPLFIVDGIPINNTFRSSTGAGTGVDAANRAIDLNAADIESMTVLKGPSATALYGIQGANGVIVITTKKGSNSAKGMTVNFSSSYAVNEILNYFPQQDMYSQGFGGVHSGGTTFSHFGAPVSTLRFDGSTNNPKNPNGFIVDMNDPSAIASARVPAYDNQEDFYQKGFTFDNHLSVASNSEKGGYYFSIGHLQQEGIIPNNEFERLTAKFTAEANLTDALKIQGSVTYTNSSSVKFGRGDNFSDVIQGTLRTPITFRNADGYVLPNGEQRNWRYVAGSPFGFGPDNPYWTVNENPYEDEVNRLLGYLQTEYKVLPWLSVMYRLGTDISTDKRNQIWATGSKGGDSRSSSGVTGRLIEDTYVDQIINSDLFITATKQFGKDWDLSAMVGHNFFSLSNSRQYFSGRNFGIPGLYTITNTTEDLVNIDNLFEKKTTAVFSRFNVGWRGTLFAEFNMRNEWSSTLPASENSFLYGSANFAFAFTELVDIDDDILTFGKLKASFARVGNDAPIYALDTYLENASISTNLGGGVVFPINGVGGVQRENTAGNANLKPEQTDAIEFGADLRFLRDKIGLDFTWYRTTSIDQIISVAVPGSTGITNQQINSGEVENKGVEIVLTATPIKTPSLTWDILVNFTRNRNEVKELPVESIISPLYSSRLNAIQRPGLPFNSFYGNAFTRHENGEILIGADGFPTLDPEQRVIGDPNPDYLMGIRNSVSYKGLNLSFLWDIRNGGDVANVTGHWMNAQGVAEHSEARGHVVVFDGVTADGQRNTQEVIVDERFYTSSPGNRNVAERWIEDGSWIRLRDVSLSYSLPSNLTQKLSLKRLNLSVYGRN